MLTLLGLNMLAVTSPRLMKTPAAQGSSVDAVMMFGFFATFCTLVVLMYQHKMRSRVPFLVVCLAALSVYGFLEGTWRWGLAWQLFRRLNLVGGTPRSESET